MSLQVGQSGTNQKADKGWIEWWGLKYSTLMCAFYSINVYALSIRGLLHTVKTSSKRLHYLTVMTRHNTCGWPHLIYTVLIRPCLEYSSVPMVCFSKKQQAELERVQTRLQNHQKESWKHLATTSISPDQEGGGSSKAGQGHAWWAAPSARSTSNQTQNSTLYAVVRLYNDSGWTA